jgi:hypothetical protein
VNKVKLHRLSLLFWWENQECFVTGMARSTHGSNLQWIQNVRKVTGRPGLSWDTCVRMETYCDAAYETAAGLLHTVMIPLRQHKNCLADSSQCQFLEDYVTRHTDRNTEESWFDSRNGKLFYCSSASGPTLEPTQLPTLWVPKPLSSGGKAAGR